MDLKILLDTLIGAVLAQYVTTFIGIIVSRKQINIKFHYLIMTKMGVAGVVILLSFFLIVHNYSIPSKGQVLPGVVSIGLFFFLVTHVFRLITLIGYRKS